MSYAQLSKINVERLIITDPDHKVALHNTFLNAREIAQSTIDSNVDENKKLMDTLQASVSDLAGVINDSLHVFDIEMIDANIGTGFIQNAEDLIKEDKLQLLTFANKIKKHHLNINVWAYADLYKFMNTTLYGKSDQTYSFKDTAKRCIYAQSATTEGGTWHYENKADSITDSSNPIYNSSYGLIANNATYTVAGRGMNELTTESSIGDRATTWHRTSTSQPSKSAKPFILNFCNDLPTIIQTMQYSFVPVHTKFQTTAQHYSSLNEHYQDYIEIYYKNTNQNASEIKEHLECSDVLQSFDKHMYIVNELMQVALNLSKESSYDKIWELILKADKNIEDLFLPLFRLLEAVDHYAIQYYLNSSYTWNDIMQSKPVCKWLEMEIFSNEYKNKIESALESLQSSIVVASGMRSKHNQMQAAIPELVPQLEEIIQTQVKAMTSYMDGNISKMDMDLSFQTTAGKASIEELKNLELTIQSDALSITPSAKIICEYFEDTYLRLFDISIPILNTSNIVELHVIKILNHSAPIGLVDPTTGQFVANVDSIFSSVLKRSFQQYITAIKSVSDALVPKINAVIYAIDGIETNLQQYVGTSKIDEQFFM